MRKRVKRIGGRLGVLLPKDIAKAMNIEEGELVMGPVDDSLDDGAFRRAFAAVLRRQWRTFERLAAYDRGDWSPPKR